MPELPEVETIKLGLQKRIIGQKIANIEILNPKTLEGNPLEVIGGEVKEVFRRAKVLGITLRKDVPETSSEILRSAQNDVTLLFHLKMSGQVIWQGKKGDPIIGGHPTSDMRGEQPNKSTRVIFSFSDGSKLFFNDQRKFGWIKVIKNSDLQNQSFLKTLGPEPLEKEFTLKVMTEQLLRRKNQPVKVAIMDQSLIAGVGNIYASEACFLAGIDPRRKVSSLSDEDFKRLHKGVITSLQTGVDHGGSTLSHFVDAEGQSGKFLTFAYVYNRAKQPCKNCGTSIEKITLGGRGTYLCPQCQK
jgi:formamidopyrimidine-DNA glycosylase